MNKKDSEILFVFSGLTDKTVTGAWPEEYIQLSKKIVEDNKHYVKSHRGWSKDRFRIAASQILLKKAGFDEVGIIDGLYGPSTRNAFENFSELRETGSVNKFWRDEKPINSSWPRQKDLEQYYGPAGSAACTAGIVRLPFNMRIAWNKSQAIKTFRCHEKVAASAQRAFNKISAAYSPEEIKRHGFDLFGGCYNYRLMRGGSSLSTHAYGIAIDFDPERNQLKWGRDKAYLAKKECNKFWEIWESEGWLSLGRAKNYDWMHVQAAKL